MDKVLVIIGFSYSILIHLIHNIHYRGFVILKLDSEKRRSTTCFIYCRKYILQITQPSQYRCKQWKYRFAVISEATSMYGIGILTINLYVSYKFINLSHNLWVIFIPIFQSALRGSKTIFFFIGASATTSYVIVNILLIMLGMTF